MIFYSFVLDIGRLIPASGGTSRRILHEPSPVDGDETLLFIGNTIMRECM